ncbi:hypothetical protein HQ865_03900 [Mucilaginibacter mali]|uniref:Lipoprotein n=1 Tax=Mucilaginibacter mali TaxID=2740462 RepID=A0A7D4QDJ8_9SPHI|nr:hypothetical protein [Mucilaginibacter mali]QKJ28932.1 hypothetical protein HQ865_03900 [Mucilaginibacter mali]
MKAICTLILAAAALSITACRNPQTEASNKKITAYPDNSTKYKQALIAELKAHPEGFTYTFRGYTKKANAEYMSVRIKRGSFDNVEEVLVNKWNKLDGIRRTKGLGYRAAELKGLKLDLVSTGNEQCFVYEDLDRIVD